MSLTRRAFGMGLVAASAAATGAYEYLSGTSYFREPRLLSGFVGGEKKSFLGNPKTTEALRRAGIVLNPRQAGSVEMVRSPDLIAQNPDFLWPSSSVIVEIAREKGIKIRRDQVILNSPIVVYSWSVVSDGLAKAGLVTRNTDGHLSFDLLQFLKALLADKSWADLGVSELFGKARIISTDPNLSNSGFMFAGLAANLLSGDVATPATLAAVGADVEAIFRRMGYKSHSSGSQFEDYLAGGPGAYPMSVGYENQLIEWIIADPERWSRIMAGPSRPLALYPVPTVYSAHPLMSLKLESDALIDAMMGNDLQTIAWQEHGFRGPVGAPGATTHPAVQALIPARLDAIEPMPEATVMLSLLDRMAA